MNSDFTTRFLFSIQFFIEKENLFSKTETLLCAVSGGIDSMVMAQVLLDLGYRLEIAHYNYGLRGKDSEEDELLVRNWAKDHQLPFFIQKAPETFRTEPGKSLQEEARDLRYTWLETLAKDRNINHIVLAHHADDQLETILLNLVRGAGISGMRGMLPSQGMRRRPFLGKSKEEIRQFAIENNLVWREDASNSKNDYRRNQIRNQVLPLLKETAPGFETVMLRNARRFRLYETTLENQYQVLHAQFIRTESAEKRIYDLASCRTHPQGEFFLFELLKKEGFSFEETEQLLGSGETEECHQRTSTTGSLVEIKHPRLLLWKPEKREEIDFPVLPSAEPTHLEFPHHQWLTVSSLAISDVDLKNLGPFQWVSDPGNLAFPFHFRWVKDGDLMKPFGMKGKQKKLSDLLTEAAMSKEEKSRQWVMVDANNEILWVPGVRSSEVSRLKEGFEGKVVLVEVG